MIWAVAASLGDSSDRNRRIISPGHGENDRLEVRDKAVVITGAARGIGRELARCLGAAGAHVVAADLNDCSARSMSECGSGHAISMRLDVRDAGSALEMANATTRAFGRVDALVSNAALYGAYGAVASTSSRRLIGIPRWR